MTLFHIHSSSNRFSKVVQLVSLCPFYSVNFVPFFYKDTLAPLFLSVKKGTKCLLSKHFIPCFTRVNFKLFT